MQRLTNMGLDQLRSIAQRYGVSEDAARTLLDAVQRGGGTMAQFSHPELGGSGQWMRGGMIMVGDMFNNSLKALVDGLCNELSRLLDSNPFEPLPAPQPGSYGAQASFGYGGNWWPAELGQPSTSGAQNDLRYAYFPGPRRLAIQQNGVITVYDTLDHQIGGVSQQQGGGHSLTFSSQYGYVSPSQLPITWSSASNLPQPDNNFAQPQNNFAPPQSNFAPPQSNFVPANNFAPPTSQTGESEQDIFAKIERLAALRDKGVLSEQEYASKKAELLARI